jgi:HEAT repeat protein
MHTRPGPALLAMWGDRLRAAGFSGDAGDLATAAVCDRPDVRGIALALLGFSGDPLARKIVVAGLDDPYPPARVEAARAAVLLGEARGRAVLREALASDFPETALNAAAYLADLGDPSGWPVLAAAWVSPLEGMRLQVVLLVRAFLPFVDLDVGKSRVEVAGTLERAVTDLSPLVRREAVYQAAQLDAPVRRRILGIALADTDPAVARAARLRLDGPLT